MLSRYNGDLARGNNSREEVCAGEVFIIKITHVIMIQWLQIDHGDVCPK